MVENQTLQHQDIGQSYNMNLFNRVYLPNEVLPPLMLRYSLTWLGYIYMDIYRDMRSSGDSAIVVYQSVYNYTVRHIVLQG